MKAKVYTSIRSQLMAQTIFFALVFIIFAGIALWQIFSFTRLYAATTKRNEAIRVTSEQAISSAKEMDWLIQRILLAQYRGNFPRVISRQSDLLEAMADFEMFIEALNWGSESPAFRESAEGIHYKRWREKGWAKSLHLYDLPQDIRQYAGTAHLYYAAFMRYTHAIIVHTQGYLNATAEGDSAAAEKHLTAANQANKKIERFENLGSSTLNELIEITHQHSENSLKNLQKSFQKILEFVAVSAFFLLGLLFLVNHIVFSNLIAKPLERLTAEVQKVDKGGLNFSITHAGSKEIGSLILKFNELLDHLRNTTVKRDALVQEIHNHKLTEEKLRITNQTLEMKKSELTSILIDLKKSHKELSEAQMHLVEAAKLESVGRLAAGVAHEVKNPLFIIQMGIDYLSSLPEIKGASSAVSAVSHDITTALERANTIIKGMLTFATPHELSMEKASINSVIEDSLVFLKHLISSHHTQVIKSLDPSLPLITFDKQKMHQVFINLLVNAIQAMPTPGAITIKTYYQSAPRDSHDIKEGFVFIEVLDTGTGFSEKSLPRAFDPFFTTKPAGQGTGLGLAVTRKIVEMHGGSIHVENRKEGGAKVIVQMPKERRLEYAEAKNLSRG